MNLFIPPGYKAVMSVRETEIAIKEIKDLFEATLAQALKLIRVSAPLFVYPETGLNDNLSGVERPVRFDIPDVNNEVEIVHSLAKWKRDALCRYGFAPGEGIYTDMNAIRRDETLDNIHSVYADQWDWERIITSGERTADYLKATVRIIFNVFKTVEAYLSARYPALVRQLPQDVTFITGQELEDAYPRLTPKEREDAVCREYGAVFLIGIGDVNRSGKKHDDRAPDYDDWTLNGDLLFYYPLLNKAFEISSMGIRADSETLLSQCQKSGTEERLKLPYHQAVLNNMLPLTIGGGLGQSRICMYLLGKAHIGEVHAAVWPAEMSERCAAEGIVLL